jgi:hypothetical protein
LKRAARFRSTLKQGGTKMRRAKQQRQLNAILKSGACLVAFGVSLFLGGTSVAAAQMAPVPSAPQTSVDARDARIRVLEERLAVLEAALSAPRTQAPGRATARATGEAVVRTAEQPREPSGEIIDEIAAERALERTLVRGGALLLGAGQAEIEPSLTYALSESDAPVLLPTVSGQVDVAESKLRRHDAALRVSGRLGLPYGFQGEAAIGVESAYEQERLTIFGNPEAEFTREGSALSDVSVGLARTLYKSDKSAWDLVGRVSYNSRLGNRKDGAVRFGNGFEEISVSVTGLARQDPLVFVVGAAYTTSLARNGVDPGDRVGLNAATLLAVSPETSMRFGAAINFSEDTKINGIAAEGSDPVTASLQLGLTSIVSRNQLLDVGIEVGLTEDSPVVALVVALPIRLPKLY